MIILEQVSTFTALKYVIKVVSERIIYHVLSVLTHIRKDVRATYSMYQSVIGF